MCRAGAGEGTGSCVPQLKVSAGFELHKGIDSSFPVSPELPWVLLLSPGHAAELMPHHLWMPLAHTFARFLHTVTPLYLQLENPISPTLPKEKMGCLKQLIPLL